MNPALKAPPIMPAPVMQSQVDPKAVLMTVIAFLLYERQEETPLRDALKSLIHDYHYRLHFANGGKTPENCTEPECGRVQALLTTSRGGQIVMNPLSVQLMSRYRVLFQQMGHDLRVILQEKSAIEPAGRKL
jgi:hypothetical protein